MIVGVGPPRSGTTSLAHLLGGCRGARITHERGPRLFWDATEGQKERALGWLRSREGRYVGDVSYQWAHALPYVLDRVDGRVIVLRRSAEGWLESVMARVKPEAVLSPKGVGRFFPTYSCSLEKAWLRYREAFYERLDADVIIQTEALSARRGQKKVFGAAGIEKEDRRYVQECHYNRKS